MIERAPAIEGTGRFAASGSQVRIVQIDALRGLAALAVVLFHFTTKYRELYAPTLSLPFEVPWGHYGVNLFFIISGFVIFMTLTRARNWRDFVLSRFSRLYPAYWAAVALTFSVVTWLGLPGKEVSLQQALLNLLMFQTWLKVPPVDGVYWTLLVELHFYVLALLLFATGRMSQCFLWLWVLFGIRLVYWLMSTRFGIDLPYAIQRALVLDFIPWFALGICAYFLSIDGAIARAQVIATVVMAHALIGMNGGFALALIAAACFAGVVAAARGKLWGAGNPLLVWLGIISYTLYLVHENIGWAVMRQLMRAGLDYAESMPIVLAGVLLLASLLTFAVERPAMHWIRTQARRGQKRAAAGAHADPG